MTQARIRIALADDHPVVRRGLRTFLATQPGLDVVVECDTGRNLPELVSHHQVQLVLLDLLMEDSGATLVRRLQSIAPEARILVLTSSEDTDLLNEILHAGATSALLKDCTPEQLLDGIFATMRGETVLHPRIAALIASARAATGPRIQLSVRERDVLRLIADGQGNARIAAQLGIGIKTVKTHVSHLLLKLDVEDRTQAAVRALRDRLV